MGKLQIAMSDAEHEKITQLINKAQATFSLEGDKHNLGMTIIRIVEEWAKEKGIVKEKNQ